MVAALRSVRTPIRSPRTSIPNGSTRPKPWRVRVCRGSRASRSITRSERSWAGLYEISPDLHVLLGPARGCPSLLLANGSSGHGVMHAPAIGQLIAEIATHGRALALDITALRPSRFVEGDPVRGGTLL